ncbi:tetratricopeptide repeat protein [Tunturibacter empetritectus]|uniref:Zn-dependent protease n=1 Tax=Tunturiibacter empetritectus TaxID=3069691 RepID=A0A7W8MRB0_9BACT|nr:tetratricopeptide repeat protein [Edaphobacter lichenicola]MBB5317651.1 putative Zn-dependent protease [Edaphobacter lichenicola]
MIPLCFICCAGLSLIPYAEAQRDLGSGASVSTDSAEHSLSPTEEAQRLISRGQLSEAEARLSSLATQQPEPAGVERMRGMIHYQRNDFAGANSAFEKAILQDGNDLLAIQMRGVTLYRMGQSAAAIPFLERANSPIASVNADGTYVLAVCYLEVRRYDDARRIFAQQYKIPSDSAASYLFLGRMLLRRNYPAESEQMARKALQIEPGLPLAHLLLGQLALSRSNAAGAVVEFEAERTINPMDGEVYERLGDAYLRALRYEDAQQALNCALLLEPNSTGPYILLGQVLLKRDDALTALNYLLRAEHMDSSNHIIHLLLGQAFHALGRKEDATREYKIAENIQNAVENQR